MSQLLIFIRSLLGMTMDYTNKYCVVSRFRSEMFTQIWKYINVKYNNWSTFMINWTQHSVMFSALKMNADYSCYWKHPSRIFTSFCAIFQHKLGNTGVFCILQCLSLTHLDMSSFKLIRIAAVNDDDLFNYMIKLARESCHHLKTTQNILSMFSKGTVITVTGLSALTQYVYSPCLR